jgi:hypothetical protein
MLGLVLLVLKDYKLLELLIIPSHYLNVYRDYYFTMVGSAIEKTLK